MEQTGPTQPEGTVVAVANDLVHHPEGSDWRHGEKQNEKKDNWACRSSRHFYEPSRRFQ